MIKNGLNWSARKRLRAVLCSNHWVHVTVQILDLNHNYIANVSTRLMGGQVNIDADAEITRSCQLEMFDPRRSFSMLPDSPDSGALFVDRMVKVIYSVADPEKAEWFHIPVFCGPVTKIDRTDVTVSIEAQGKESLAFTGISHTFKEKVKWTSIIRNVFSDLLGEAKYEVAEKPGRTTRKVTVNDEHPHWPVIKKLASGKNYHLFYNGRGVGQMRMMPTKSVFTMDEKFLKGSPQISYNTSEVKNSVVVIGAKPKGAKNKIRVRVNAPRSHPFSPWSIGRGGVPRYLTEKIEDDSIKTIKAAKALARKRLKAKLVETLDIQVDCLPVPHLEELDVFRIHTNNFNGTARLRKMTIPLTADGTASVGYLRRTTPNRKAIRKRRR